MIRLFLMLHGQLYCCEQFVDPDGFVNPSLWNCIDPCWNAVASHGLDKTLFA